jgi:hypothetical protein
MNIKLQSQGTRGSRGNFKRQPLFRLLLLADMSSVLRSRAARITLSNLSPGPNSQHAVGIVVVSNATFSNDLFGSKNALVEVKALVAEERPDEVTRARKLAQAMVNQKLDSRVVRHRLRRGFRRRAL